MLPMSIASISDTVTVYEKGIPNSILIDLSTSFLDGKIERRGPGNSVKDAQETKTQRPDYGNSENADATAKDTHRKRKRRNNC